MFLFVKPDWMTESQFRMVRTAAQVFGGVFFAALIQVLSTYANPPHVFNWNVLWYQGIVIGASATIAKFMNKD